MTLPIVVPGTNHYTVLLGQHPKVTRALRAFLGGRTSLPRRGLGTRRDAARTRARRA